MDFFLLPLEWWEDGSTGFPPEAWEPDPTHFDGHTVCANCGFILNGKVVAHYFAEPISMNHPPRPSLWGPIFANTMPWLLLTTETSEQANELNPLWATCLHHFVARFQFYVPEFHVTMMLLPGGGLQIPQGGLYYGGFSEITRAWVG